MRNLIGRLNARSQSDLDRIASAWRVVVTAPDKSGTVAQIVRTLTDLRSVRDAWSELSDDDRNLIAALAASREAQTLDALAQKLTSDPADVRATAVRLYRSGWIAREGDNSELKIDEQPRLFVPPELAHAVNRVRAEISAGDRSGVSLAQLLRELDQVELEAAAQVWNASIVAGLRSRDELIAIITGTIAEPGAIERVANSLDRDAMAIYQLVRGGAVEGTPLPDALRATSLDPNAPAGAPSIRAMLGKLERSLLVWHGYDWKGDRLLFVPGEIRQPAPKAALDPPAAIELTEESKSTSYHFHLAWDLLTLLRGLVPEDRPRTRAGDSFPGAFLERLNRRFWYRGAERPPDGYVPFLTSLGIAEGLIVGADGRAPLTVAPDIRSWRDRSFDDQDARLRWRWLTAIDWIEGSEQNETHIWGADWRTMRRSLLEALADLPDGSWRPLDLFAGWIIDREPGLLGRAYTVALGTGVDDDGAEARRQAAQAVISLTIRRAFVWFGLVDVRRAAAHGFVLRLTERGRAIATGKALDATAGSSRFGLKNDGEIILTDPTPLQIWSVSAFAEQIELAAPARYRLTARSIERAIEAGFQASQIATFLRNQTGTELPAGVAELLEKEQRDHPIVSLAPATIVTPQSEAARDEITRILSAASIGWEEIGADLVIRAAVADLVKLSTMFKSGGFVVRDG